MPTTTSKTGGVSSGFTRKHLFSKLCKKKQLTRSPHGLTRCLAVVMLIMASAASAVNSGPTVGHPAAARSEPVSTRGSDWRTKRGPRSSYLSTPPRSRAGSFKHDLYDNPDATPAGSLSGYDRERYTGSDRSHSPASAGENSSDTSSAAPSEAPARDPSLRKRLPDSDEDAYATNTGPSSELGDTGSVQSAPDYVSRLDIENPWREAALDGDFPGKQYWWRYNDRNQNGVETRFTNPRELQPRHLKDVSDDSSLHGTAVDHPNDEATVEEFKTYIEAMKTEENQYGELDELISDLTSKQEDARNKMAMAGANLDYWR